MERLAAGRTLSRAEEFAHVRNAVDEAAAGDREPLDGAGRPTDLERFLEELLGR